MIRVFSETSSGVSCIPSVPPAWEVVSLSSRSAKWFRDWGNQSGVRKIIEIFIFPGHRMKISAVTLKY
jgi:hypothetical protein